MQDIEDGALAEGTSSTTVFVTLVVARLVCQVVLLLMGPEPKVLRNCESKYFQVGGVAQGRRCLSGQLQEDQHVRLDCC